MVNIADVARHAGVSASTVSYVISGARPIGPETKARVRAAMDELGYVPNAAARSLVTRRSNVLALVYPTAVDGVGGTIAEFIRAAADRAREAGYQLVLWPFRKDEAHSVRDLVRQGMADGVLVMEVALEDERIDVLEGAGIPYTMIGRTRDVTHRASVDVDFDATVLEALEMLTALGHTRIAFVNHSEASAREGYGPTERAEAAYRAYLRQAGLTPVARHCDDSPAAGRLVGAELLDLPEPPTAILTMNEMATFGIFGEARHRRIRIPEQLSVVGLVTSPNVATMSYPPMTCMHAPGAELGRLAVDQLLSQLDPARSAVPNALIPCTFVAGMSLGPAPA